MQTLEARVEKVTPTKSGKALRVKFQGNETWYGAFLKSGIDKAVGSAVVAEVEDDETYGPQIKGWKAMANQGADSKAPAVGGGVQPWFMPFCSNLCAHAIQAGLIKEPKDIGPWARAAMLTAIALESDVPV